MATIFDVSKQILTHFDYGISTMKLQKLAYFAQSWFLAATGEPLFDEDFQAWENGPVCKELYSYHRGKYTVSYADFKKGSQHNLDYIQRNIIDIVVNKYGNYSGDELSELTHLNGSPWATVRFHNPDARNALIPKRLIKEQFEYRFSGN